MVRIDVAPSETLTRAVGGNHGVIPDGNSTDASGLLDDLLPNPCAPEG
jgi:hypothetical protein